MCTPTGGSDDVLASDENHKASLVRNVAHHMPTCSLLRSQAGRNWEMRIQNSLGSSATYLKPEYIPAYSTTIPKRMHTLQ